MSKLSCSVFIPLLSLALVGCGPSDKTEGFVPYDDFLEGVSRKKAMNGVVLAGDQKLAHRLAMGCFEVSADLTSVSN